MRFFARLILISSNIMEFGCAMHHIEVPITRPAELDLRTKRSLAVENIDSTNGSRLRSAIESSIYESDHFELVRTADFKPDENFETALADRRDAMLVRVVVFRDGYEESVEAEESTCVRESRGKKIKYRCTKSRRRGAYLGDFAFELIDLETRERLKPKRITCERKKTRYGRGGRRPGSIDAAKLTRRCIRAVTRDFMRAIAPWEDRIRLPFQTDGDLPELEDGVIHARNGDWELALDRFRAAVGHSESLADSNVRSKAHFNLALAFMATQDFEGARASLQTAMSLSDNRLFGRELKRLKALEQERDRLQGQRLRQQEGVAAEDEFVEEPEFDDSNER